MAKKTKTPSPRLPHKRSSRVHTENALRDAAMKVFAKFGYDGATTREIAKRAKANETLIQRYFGGKQGLLEAILSADFESGAKSRCMKSLQGDSLLEVLTSFFSAECSEIETEKEFMKVAVSRAILDSKIGSIVKKGIYTTRLPAMEKQVKDLQASGIIRPDIPALELAYSLASFSFVVGFFGKIVYRTPPELLDRVVQTFSKVLIEGLLPRRPK